METTRIIRRNINFDLTREQMADYGNKLAQIEGQILDLEEERARFKRQFKSQLTLLEQQKGLLSHIMRAGNETRDVDVVEVKDFENKVVRYLHGARLVDQRPMTPDELQLEIPVAPTHLECPGCGAKAHENCYPTCPELAKRKAALDDIGL